MEAGTLLVLLLNGLSAGMLLFLIAVGLSLIFGVMEVLNFAHGSLYMLGAYTTYHLVDRGGVNFWAAILIAPFIVAIVGGVVEALFIRRVYQSDITTQLLLTFAFVLILNDVVRLFWGSGPRTVASDLLSHTIQPLGRSYPIYNLFLIVMGPIIGVFIWQFLQRTRAGQIMRAASQDRMMTGLLGIDVPRVYTLVFMFGTWLAALGGGLAAPLRSISPALGEAIIIESFIVAVIGGLGSLPGSLVGAIIIGLINSFGIRYAQGAQEAFPFILMALVLLARPRGLFGESSP